MPTYEDFAGHVEAHLLFIDALPPADALDVLRRRLRDGSWRDAPLEWMTRLQVLASRHSIPAREIDPIRSELIEALLPLGFGKAAHHLIGTLLGWDYGVTRDEAERIVAWFVGGAGPGEASLAADLLQSASYLHRGVEHAWIRTAVQPIARWLVRNGSAELRSRRRGTMALEVAHAVWELDRDPALLEQTLRVVFANETPLGSNAMFPHDPRRLIGLVEHASSSPRSSLPLALVLASTQDFAGHIVDAVIDPPDEWPEAPRCRLALLRALVDGALPAWPLGLGWRAAFWAQFPDDADLSFRRLDVLDVAMASLHQHAGFKWRHNDHGVGRGPSARTWARFLASEFIRIRELCAPAGVRAGACEALERCVGFDPVIDEGVHDALVAALGEPTGSDTRALARSILLSPSGTRMGPVKAALRTLPHRVTHAGTAAVAADDLGIEILFARIINHAWSDRIAGVDVAKLLRSGGLVRLADLDAEDKVRFQEGAILLDAAALRGAIDLPLPPEERRALAALYFVHELVHVAQAVGDKRTVTQLRSTGFAGETNLMHVDLGADHAAARIIETVFPAWRLAWLKDLQGKSLAAFPSSALHSSGGRARKAMRLVGLRVDILARTLGAIPAELLGEGYAFADFGPGGGNFLVLVSGPPFTFVGSTSHSADDASTLATAIDHANDPTALRQVDETLTRLLKSSCEPGSA